MSTDNRTRIRTRIRPFTDEVTYPTGWAGYLTFQQIIDQVTPWVVWQCRRFGFYGQDIPDALQTGFMNLWQDLAEDPNLLADFRRENVKWHVFRRAQTHFNRHYNYKQIPFTDIEAQRGYEIEEYGISGLSGRHPRNWWDATERWATWTRQLDARLDITDALHAMAEEYADDIKGLVGLYILTTTVGSKEALDGFNLAHSMVYERITAIKHRLQRVLADYEPIHPRTWQERLADGEVEPYLAVVEHYKDKPLALKALYTLTTDAHVRKVAKDEKERKMITYYRKKCRKRIEAAYGQAASF
jgi:hypothetical protein